MTEKTIGKSGLVLSLFVIALVSACGGPGKIGSSGGGSYGADIIGGGTDSGDPSVVALFGHLPGAQKGFLCTASLISPTVLLTAAHCVDPAAIGAGNVFLAVLGTTLSAPTAVLQVASTAFDPAFDVNNVGNGHDVGVAMLAQPSTLKPLPINRNPLPITDFGATVRLVGFGADTHADTGAGTKRSVTTFIDTFDDKLIMIGSSGRQTCHGDSGGPAIQRLNGVDTIIGITSYGRDFVPDEVCFAGGFDTRVDAVASFIDAYLK